MWAHSSCPESEVEHIAQQHIFIVVRTRLFFKPLIQSDRFWLWALVTQLGTCFSAGPGDISSDLYRPQSQDEIFEFSFFVALSYESNLQLGCFWWKISTSSLKTFFYKFCAYFCKSHVQTWELRFSKIYMIEGWWVKKNALSHSHFHYW